MCGSGLASVYLVVLDGMQDSSPYSDLAPASIMRCHHILDSWSASIGPFRHQSYLWTAFLRIVPTTVKSA